MGLVGRWGLFEEVSAMNASNDARVGTRARLARTLAACVVLLSLCIVQPSPWATIAAAAPNESISITAEHDTVKAGDEVTLKIKLRDVKDAMLNGEALKGDKVNKKVLVCATTTYTVDGMAKDGKKLSQSLTINASGTSTKPACLPDLVIADLTVTQANTADDPTQNEFVAVNFTMKNQGGTAANGFAWRLSANGAMYDVKHTYDLAPGASTPVQFGEDWPHGATITATLVLDPGANVTESNKQNNEKAVTFTVQ
jgi:hypothetical protein